MQRRSLEQRKSTPNYNLEKNTEIFREYLEKTQKELKYAQGARAAAGLTSPDDGLISAIDEYLKNN